MEKKTIIFICTGVLIGIAASFLVYEYTDGRESDTPIQLKITFDSIETPNGRIVRMTDCDTHIVCLSAFGVVSCASPNWKSKNFYTMMNQRCK